MQFLSASGFGAAQMFFFLIPTRNIFAWESAKQGFWLCYGRIFFTMLSELSFVNEWGFLSETVLKNKWSFLLVFVGFETFLPENLKLINSEHEILDHLFSGPNFGSYSVTQKFFFLGQPLKPFLQPPELFFKEAALTNCAMFTGKHLYWSLFLIKLQA